MANKFYKLYFYILINRFNNLSDLILCYRLALTYSIQLVLFFDNVKIKIVLSHYKENRKKKSSRNQ